MWTKQNLENVWNNLNKIGESEMAQTEILIGGLWVGILNCKSWKRQKLSDALKLNLKQKLKETKDLCCFEAKSEATSQSSNIFSVSALKQTIFVLTTIWKAVIAKANMVPSQDLGQSQVKLVDWTVKKTCNTSISLVSPQFQSTWYTTWGLLVEDWVQIPWSC
jgi:hypothetical protein